MNISQINEYIWPQEINHKKFDFPPPPIYSFTPMQWHWESHDDQKLQVIIFEQSCITFSKGPEG